MLSKTVLSNCVVTKYLFGNSLYNGNILYHTTRQDEPLIMNMNYCSWNSKLCAFTFIKIVKNAEKYWKIHNVIKKPEKVNWCENQEFLLYFLPSYFFFESSKQASHFQFAIISTFSDVLASDIYAVNITFSYIRRYGSKRNETKNNKCEPEDSRSLSFIFIHIKPNAITNIYIYMQARVHVHMLHIFFILYIILHNIINVYNIQYKIYTYIWYIYIYLYYILYNYMYK